MNRFLATSRCAVPTLALGAFLAAQAPAPLVPSQVLFDRTGTGAVWALGTTYKASFDTDGFTYLPFFGSHAPKNYPVRFALRSVRVGGTPLEFSREVPATRSDQRVTFDRGVVKERYDLDTHGVEQSFVVTTETPGDVDVELEAITELTEDATRPGVNFGNELGRVEYGTAFLVDGESKRTIPSFVSGRSLRLHVPAAQRGRGPVVIDPLITTDALTPTLMNSDLPDIAYDATTDRFAVVWVHAFSAVDHDVVAEVRSGNGGAVAGGFQPIEISGDRFSSPRVANLNSADRFLVTMELYRPLDPQGKYSIWGRVVDAPSPVGVGALFPISASSTQDQYGPDVGGDSGTGNQWTVVWVRGSDIVARQVSANGVPAASTIPIETNPGDLCYHPAISLSNGNGLTPNPRWCIVYNREIGPSLFDVYGATLDQNGVVTKAHSPIVTGGYDLYPQVSSPRIDATGAPSFMVSYERQQPAPEMVVRVLDSALRNLVPETNLTRTYGFSNTYSRVESDGIRFAATCAIGATLRIGTLAVINSTISLHESLQSLGSGVAPHVASKRSGGGPAVEYGVAFISTSSTPARAAISIYQGRTQVGGFNRRGTSCGLGLNFSGRPAVGGTLTVSLSFTGTEPAGFLLGIQAPSQPICGSCLFGLLATGPLLPLPTPAILDLPTDPIFVGGTFAMQGYAFGSGNCTTIGNLRLSDTLEVTLQ